jgi:hypothetical protein
VKQYWGVGRLIDELLGLDVWIYCTLNINTFRDYRQLQCYRYSTYFPVHRCTRTRVLRPPLSYPGNGFIAVSQLLQIARGVFFSQPNSFLANILQLPILKTRLDYFRLVLYNPFRLLAVPFITRRQGHHGKHRLLLLRMRVYWPVT